MYTRDPLSPRQIARQTRRARSPEHSASYRQFKSRSIFLRYCRLAGGAGSLVRTRLCSNSLINKEHIGNFRESEPKLARIRGHRWSGDLSPGNRSDAADRPRVHASLGPSAPGARWRERRGETICGPAFAPARPRSARLSSCPWPASRAPPVGPVPLSARPPEKRTRTSASAETTVERSPRSRRHRPESDAVRQAIRPLPAGRSVQSPFHSVGARMR